MLEQTSSLHEAEILRLVGDNQEFADAIKLYQETAEVPLTTGEIVMNGHYWNENLKTPEGFVPEVYQYREGFYPSHNGESELISQFMPGVNVSDYLYSRIENIDEVRAEIDRIRDTLKEALEKGNVAILVNHSTLLNINNLASVFNKEFEVPNEDQYAMVGGRILTSKIWLEVARNINIIGTIPDTPNGRIDHLEGGEELQRKIRRNGGTTVIKGLRQGTGKIFWVSPQGTSDSQLPGGKLGIKLPPESARSIVGSFNLNASVLTIGTNDLEIQPENGLTLSKGDLHIRCGEVHPPKSIERFDEEAHRSALVEIAELVTDTNGQCIGVIEGLTIVGQGSFGEAKTNLYEKHFKDSNTEVTGIEGSDARENPFFENKEFVSLCIPAGAVQASLEYIRANPNSAFILAAKGPDAKTLYDQLTPEEKDRVIIWSGPNKAEQISNYEPSAAVIAGTNRELLERFHQEYNHSYMRLYMSDSPNVIQLSGILKNLVVLELGKVWHKLRTPEQKTVLLMRALKAAYSVVKKNAPENENPEEFWGIAGLGDILLCMEFFENSEGSRNFKYGKLEADGKSHEEIVKKLETETFEGLPTSQAWEEQAEWLETEEMTDLWNDLDYMRAHPFVARKDKVQLGEHSDLFAAVFEEFETICEERNYSENTRAWAFCRLYKELKKVYCGPYKRDELLSSITFAVLSHDTSHDEVKDLPECIDPKEDPILAAFADIRHAEKGEERDKLVKALEESLLNRNTEDEGFRKAA